MSARWNREAAITELHRDLHWFLSSAAVHSSLPTIVDELWDLPPGFRQRMLAAHLLAHPRTRYALHAAVDVLRRMPPRAVRQVEEHRGHVAGPVLWQRTATRRIATADPTLFVTQPTTRTWNTPATALIRSSLLRIQWLLALYPPVGTTGIAVEIREVSDLVQDLLGDRKLRRVSPHPPNAAVRSAVISRMPPIGDLALVGDAAQRIISGEEESTLAEALLGNVLAPGKDDQLFELWTGLTILRRLRSLGATVIAGPWDSAASSRHFAEIEFSGRRYVLEWQRSYWSTPVFKGPGRYATALRAADLDVSSLRPDFLLYDEDGTRAVLVEVKFSAREEHSPDRAGTIDCLAYQHDLETASERPRDVVSLVVASSTAATSSAGEICIADPDALRSSEVVVDQLLGSTSA